MAHAAYITHPAPDSQIAAARHNLNVADHQYAASFETRVSKMWGIDERIRRADDGVVPAELTMLLTLKDRRTRYDTDGVKAHPRPFLLAARKMREKPRNILFVGDSPQRDIRGAQEIGMETAWARYGYPKRYLTAKHHHQAKHAKGIKADHTLSRISELLAILPKPKKD
jgi:hypothetical protein